MPSFVQALTTLALLLGLALPGITLLLGAAFVPWRREHWAIETLARRARRHALPLAALFSVAAAALVQSRLDPVVTAWLAWDFTGIVAPREAGVHAFLQDALPRSWLQFPVALAYLLGFPALVYFTAIYFAWLDRPRDLHRSVAAYVLCFVLALPFYFFTPVEETWTTGQAENLALLQPWVSEWLYAFNEVNNAFPSLHTAMSVSVAYAAWTSGNRAYGRFAAGLAGVIVFSTVYLGIHWIADVAAGLVLAVAVCWILDRRWPAGTYPKEDP